MRRHPKTFSRHPRGALTVSDRQREAVRMYRAREGTAAEIAERFGVAEATLRGWAKKVEDAEADARHRRGLT